MRRWHITQSFEAVPFVIVVFDHLITLDDEINTIWRNPTVGLASKVAFVVNRYLTEAVIAYTVYSQCRRFIWVFGIACVVAGAISHFIVLLRVYSLWDRRAIVARMLTLAFTGSISAITVLGVFAAIQMQPELSFLEPLHICVLGSTPKVIVGLLGVLVGKSVLFVDVVIHLSVLAVVLRLFPPDTRHIQRHRSTSTHAI
ncbi:hypothetical protein DFH07DRAFT_862037 [Mycena maculata]|uniref:DUF6533 domain-containing protein n=1 Tax=Mycena maculata TaxID=230809 RepID=A0AAD7MGN8_9AGAR|nr:hypothetical protein DFH07DRAFT_862037 [Mycena maculata]